MNKDWLNDPYVQKWLGKKTKKTQKNYVSFFPSWLAFIKMSPSEQIQKKVKDLQSSDITERTWFEDKVIEYRNFLQTQFDSESTIKAYLTCVRSFFSSNRLPLSFGRGELRVEVSQKVIEQKWIPSNIEIRVLYGQADVRDRGLLLVLYQSGFSEIDVSSLNIEHLDNIYEHETHLFIEKRREKTNIIQATCISAEAVHDIKSMLRERGNPQKGALFVTPKGKRLSVRFINQAMKKLAKKAYPDKDFKTKSLRSAYNSALLRANIQPQELKDVLMGHKRLGARGHYAYDQITILEAYEKAFKYLSINHGTQTRKDLERVEQSLLTLTKTIAKQQDQIAKLNEVIELLYPNEVTRNIIDEHNKIASWEETFNTPEEYIESEREFRRMIAKAQNKQKDEEFQEYIKSKHPKIEETDEHVKRTKKKS